MAETDGKRKDSRVLVAPIRPRDTSHFSSPVVVWNPEAQCWHLYFHFYRNENLEGFGYQKTALAFTKDLASENWTIHADDNRDCITPFLAQGSWINSQLSYHAVCRLPDRRWLALIRGVTVGNETSNLGFGVSDDGIRWALMDPLLAITTTIAERVVKPVGIAIIASGEVRYIWSTYYRDQGYSRGFISKAGKFVAENSQIFLEGWEPSDGASSFWRDGNTLHIFSGNHRYTFS